MALAKRVDFEDITKAPSMGLKEIRYDTANPGVNAWASRKGRAIVLGVNEPRCEFLIDALVFSATC